jgi:multidrug efflux pump subunit AcrB
LSGTRSCWSTSSGSLVDPIFQGLGISLLLGLASSTALTLLVIPAIYWVFGGER